MLELMQFSRILVPFLKHRKHEKSFNLDVLLQVGARNTKDSRSDQRSPWKHKRVEARPQRKRKKKADHSCAYIRVYNAICIYLYNVSICNQERFGAYTHRPYLNLCAPSLLRAYGAVVQPERQIGREKLGRGGAPREEKETEKRSKEKEEETDGRGRGGEIEALDKRVVGWQRWQGETESVESSSSRSREPAGLLS